MLDGVPLITLKEKFIDVEYLDLGEEERKVYDVVEVGLYDSVG